MRAADLAGASESSTVTLPVSQRVPAGQTAEPLAAGTVARIFTGATVPPGADTIVMQEMVRADNAGATFSHVQAQGEWITQQGADIRRGSVILPASACGLRRRRWGSRHRWEALRLKSCAKCA